MTTSALLSNLIARGIEFQAHGDMLRFRPVERLAPEEVETIRRHKAVILKLLRAEARISRHPAASPYAREVCDRCESTDFTEVLIHDGQSLRRDCTRCHRFMGWPRWYGRALFEKGDTETRHED